MKIKIKSEVELKKLENYIGEDEYSLIFKLKTGQPFYLNKDFINKNMAGIEKTTEIPEYLKGTEFYISEVTGRRFLKEWVESVEYDSLEKAEEIKNAPAKEVLSIPTDNHEKMKELEELSKPLVEWLNKNFCPHHIIVIQTNYVGVQQGVFGIPFEVKD